MTREVMVTDADRELARQTLDNFPACDNPRLRWTIENALAATRFAAVAAEREARDAWWQKVLAAALEERDRQWTEAWIHKIGIDASLPLPPDREPEPAP